ncbi:MAG: hypothetical protein WAQ57_03755 [Candidatus Saccharimonadales bacterium]
MGKRDIIKIGGKSYYAERDKRGRFTDITNIGKSIHADAKKSNAKTVTKGHGHLGDLKKKK